MLYRFDGFEPQVGLDSYVSETAQVIGQVVIGNGCYVGHGAILRGDYGRIELGDETAIEEGAILHAPPAHTYSIGRRVTVGHGAILHGTVIGDWAVIGMGAVLSLRSEVGEWAIVAEGAVVRMRQVIPPRQVVGGNPAEVLRELEEKDLALWSFGKQLYVDLAKKYLAVGMQALPCSQKASQAPGDMEPGVS
ncbi:MAG: gamma carbonic anhydrase family protein [Polyangia bacterium]|mgnify:CR=1 FL=1|jgi:carbonic anhydrase/acetyltransferase-like protein (isoleucine patch superfamily)|nr:gamma carbonic anhydrase family protein [Polyangia bacterium]